MSRYLTPGKIGLLMLVSLYASGFVRDASSVALLSFLLANILPTRSNDEDDVVAVQPGPFAPLSVADFEAATAAHASTIPRRSVWHMFLQEIWFLNSLDALHGFFENLPRLFIESAPEDEEREHEERDGLPPLQRAYLSKISPCGVFVRRCGLEFARLQLDDSIALWKRFVRFRAPSYAAWRHENPAERGSSVDCSLDALPGDSSGAAAFEMVMYGDLESDDGAYSPWDSSEEVERLLERHSNFIQKDSTRLSAEMRSHLDSIRMTGSEIPNLLHYIKFLDSWKALDYTSCFDNLHRYFDCTMLPKDKIIHQYALLNQALISADFACFSEAIAAMQESITIAREGRDMVCLNFGFSWMYHMNKAFPKIMDEILNIGAIGSEKETVAFLRARAKETGTWNLFTSILLADSKLIQAEGEQLSAAFEAVERSSHVNLTKGLNTSIGNQTMVKAALLNRLGLTQSSWSLHESFLQCHTKHYTLEDRVHHTCRLADIMVARGQHREALEALAPLGPDLLRFPKYKRIWAGRVMATKLDKAVLECDFEASKYLLACLRSMRPLHQEVIYAYSMLEIEMKLRQGDFVGAMAACDKRYDIAIETGVDQFQVAKLLVTKARIYDRLGLPLKGTTIALRAADMAHRARFLPVLWEAIVALGRILLGLAELGAADVLLRSIAPLVLETEDVKLIGTAFSCLADVHMGLARAEAEEDGEGEDVAGSKRGGERLARALGSLDQALDAYSTSGDVVGQAETLAKRAVVMRVMGDVVGANDSSARYLELQRDRLDTKD